MSDEGQVEEFEHTCPNARDRRMVNDWCDSSIKMAWLYAHIRTCLNPPIYPIFGVVYHAKPAKLRRQLQSECMLRIPQLSVFRALRRTGILRLWRPEDLDEFG